MAVLLGAIVLGSSGTTFAASNSISANDINNKQTITRMHKGSTTDMRSDVKINHKKTKKHHKRNSNEVKASSTAISN